MNQLYGGYRGDLYFKYRHKKEFWYTKKINYNIGSDSREIARRQKNLTGFLCQYINTHDIENVLDFGGDRGQFVPPSIGKNKYVYEVSGVTPVAGVAKFDALDKLGSYSFDLVIVANVLEHLPDPVLYLTILRESVAKNQNCYFYFEVPYEQWSLSCVPSSGIFQIMYKGYLGLLIKHNWLRKLTDFYSTICRAAFNIIPPGGIIKLHEHINFYSVEALRELLEGQGFEIVGASLNYENKSVATYAGTINVLAKFKKS